MFTNLFLQQWNYAQELENSENSLWKTQVVQLPFHLKRGCIIHRLSYMHTYI